MDAPSRRDGDEVGNKKRNKGKENKHPNLKGWNVRETERQAMNECIKQGYTTFGGRVTWGSDEREIFREGDCSYSRAYGFDGLEGL